MRSSSRPVRVTAALARWISLVSIVGLGWIPMARAQVEKEKILDTVRAVFDAYEQIPCAGLKFEYEGDPPSLPTQERGAIVVYFADANIWTAGSTAYLAKAETGNAENKISKAWMGFNAATFWWTITDEVDPDKIDMETALMKLMPGVLGFYVGAEPKGGSVDIQLGVVDRTIDEQRELGAKAVYFDDQANGCSEARPADPPDCDAVSAIDAGVGGDAADAGAPTAEEIVCLFRTPKGGRSFHWEGSPIPYYVFVPADGKLPGGTGATGAADAGATAASDAGAGNGFVQCTETSQCDDGEFCSSNGICISESDGDGGCCRIGRTREEDLTYGALIALALFVFVGRQRRRRRR